MSENTHVTTTPNRKPTDIEVLRGNLNAPEFEKSIENYYKGNKSETLKFKTSIIDYVRAVPNLLKCERISLLSAFAKSAQFRFMPSNVGGECYILPYGNQAKFQLGYQGIITLLFRTNKISTITSQIIYENDTFEYEEGLDAKLIHKPAMFGKTKGEAIGVYTVVTMTDGNKSFKVMDKDGVMGIKKLSKAQSSKESPWNSDKDPEKWMWKKSCLIQHAKLLPKTEEIIEAIGKDNEVESGETPLDAEGPATGKASHAPEIKDAEVMDTPPNISDADAEPSYEDLQ